MFLVKIPAQNFVPLSFSEGQECCYKYEKMKNKKQVENKANELPFPKKFPPFRISAKASVSGDTETTF